MTEKYIFGEKHREYLKRCAKSRINVAEGAVRAGKTVDNIFAFAMLLDSSPDRLHLATGTTAGSAKLILGDCGGFGLESYFAGRSSWGKYKGNECLKVYTPAGEKIVVFAGGKNADSYKKIRGGSYGMWIATEINLHHESMIREAFNRQLAAKDRRVFWDLNPSPPGASIYRDHIDLYAKRAAAGELPEDFFNYCHFTIFDNPAVTEERLREIVSQYDRDSVWYRRDILGERCAADGAVYPRFQREYGSIVLPDDSLAEEDISFINVGIDFGGNRSKTAFAACAFLRDSRGEGGICMVADHAVSGGKGDIDSERVNREAEEFLIRLSKLYPGTEVRYIFCDSEAQYLINGLKKHLRRAGIPSAVEDSAKKRIRDRIDCVNSLMARGRFHVLERCSLVTRGLSEAIWDSGAAEDRRLDNFTSDIDILDAMEYAFERYMGKL